MTIEIKVPVLPESIRDATVLTWHKKPGDTVKRDENLVDLETDKVVLEVPAPADGVLKSIAKAQGTVVLAEEVLGAMEAGAVAAAAPAKTTASTTPASAKAAAADMSPAVRRLAAEHDVNPQQLSGSGKGGRVTKDDIMSVLKGEAKSATQAAATSAPAFVASGAREEKRVPMSRLRARIAERLVEAQHTAAMLTTFNEVNLQAVMDLRNRYKESFEKKHGVKLGFMSFFTRAVVEALKRFPEVNASIDGTDVVYHGYYDIGIAVSTERGLVVPVLRNAEQMSFAEIEKAVVEFSGKARDGHLSLEEMSGGTFTITNGGVFGSLLSTPIVNPPQAAILGMHKIEERPMVDKGQVVVRPMMYVAMSYDHRLIDGKDSVRFLVAVKELLEDPARLLLEI